MALDTAQMKGLSTPERGAVIARLAPHLMDAAAAESEAGADDGR
jgi:hypothetical protein